MPDTIGAGEKTLQFLLYLAQKGITTESEIAAALSESPIQARRYLNTLAKFGFAKKQEGKWLLGLAGYRLPHLYMVTLRSRFEAVALDADEFISRFFGALTTNEGE